MLIHFRSKMEPVVKLTYFKVHGKAEHINLILHAGKVKLNIKAWVSYFALFLWCYESEC